MYLIKVESSFSAAHNLNDYHGTCERLHGHNWRVEAVFAYRMLEKSGKAIDFTKAKAQLKAALADFDHAYLNKVKALKGVNPTSENIARFIYGRIKKLNHHIDSVSVWENEGSCATYSKK